MINHQGFLCSLIEFYWFRVFNWFKGCINPLSHWFNWDECTTGRACWDFWGSSDDIPSFSLQGYCGVLVVTSVRACSEVGSSPVMGPFNPFPYVSGLINPGFNPGLLSRPWLFKQNSYAYCELESKRLWPATIIPYEPEFSPDCAFCKNVILTTHISYLCYDICPFVHLSNLSLMMHIKYLCYMIILHRTAFRTQPNPPTYI
jgi:hypothetical protein